VQTQTTTSPNPYQTAYDPQASYANSQGLVAAPNVDPVTEALNQVESVNEFKASANLFKIGEELDQTTLNLIS
jgi:flagellar basal-body rod protein FlgC